MAPKNDMTYTFADFVVSQINASTVILEMHSDSPKSIKDFSLCRDIVTATSAFNEIWGGIFPFDKIEVELTEQFKPFLSFLNANIRYGADQTRWYWSSELMDRRLPYANEILFKQFRKKVLDRISKVDTDIIQAVTDVLRESGDLLPTLTQVARRLCISERALQRQLQANDISFRQLTNEARILRAKLALEETMLPLGEIAWRLGYRDLSSFSRAFKHATGFNPARFRRNTPAEH